jgi:hypothetical protein
MSKASDTSHACDIMSHGSMAFTDPTILRDCDDIDTVSKAAWEVRGQAHTLQTPQARAVIKAYDDVVKARVEIHDKLVQLNNRLSDRSDSLTKQILSAAMISVQKDHDEAGVNLKPHLAPTEDTVPSGWFVAVLTANYHWHGANAKSCAAFKRID